MDSESSLAQKLPEIVDLARLAPSVHNTQPWQVRSKDTTIEVSIRTQYALKDGDPTRRQTIISLGIFCESLSIVSQAYGFITKKIVCVDDRATLWLEKGKPDPKSQTNVELLQRRCTDRSLYKPAHLDEKLLHTLQKAARFGDIKTLVITERSFIDKLASLTSKGISLALSNPAFRRELSHYLVVPWSKKNRGISVRSLYIPWLLAIFEPWLIRWGIGLKTEASLEKKRWLSASGVVLILGDGDFSKYWFDAGRTYLRVSLAIEAAGLSQATSAAIVEASNYHEDIEEELHTSQRILCVIRIGKGKGNRAYSPRVSAEDLLH